VGWDWVLNPHCSLGLYFDAVGEWSSAKGRLGLYSSRKTPASKLREWGFDPRFWANIRDPFG